MDNRIDMDRITDTVHAALRAAGLWPIAYGPGVLGCGDTDADHPSSEAAYGEITVVVADDLSEVSVGVIWRNDEGEAIDGDGADFGTDDLDGIVAEVKRLVGGAA